jgi:hypothetical protein
MGPRNGRGPGCAAQSGGRLAGNEAPQVHSGPVLAPMWPGRGCLKVLCVSQKALHWNKGGAP